MLKLYPKNEIVITLAHKLKVKDQWVPKAVCLI
jgi:hypothetical protein